MLYLKRGAYQWPILYSGWLWYCEDNIHVYAIEFEETLSDIVMDGFVHHLPYLMTSCFALCGQGSHQRHCIRIWDPDISVGRCHPTFILIDIRFCSRRRTIALQLYATWCLWGFWYRKFQWDGTMRNSFLMVDYCKELGHLWCASWRSVYRGICRWLRSWLACIAKLAGYSRLDENQFGLRTFGSFLTFWL